MTRAQYERQKLMLARQRELDLLRRSREHANPGYVRSAAGFWLARCIAARPVGWTKNSSNRPLRPSARIARSEARAVEVTI